jgi:hypothetical protein
VRINRFFKYFLAAAVLAAAMFPLSRAYSEEWGEKDKLEKAGIAVAVSAGNLWFVPLKAISTSMGLLSGGLSYVLTGGNADLTRQIWRDTLQGPYLITPELAEKSIGERPELLQENVADR